MTASHNYFIDFIERTHKLFDILEPIAKKKDLEVTFLLNCLLGMIVSVLENLDKLDNNNLFKEKLHTEKLEEIVPKKIKAIRKNDTIISYKENFNKQEFLKKFDKTEFSVEESVVKFMSRTDIMNMELEWLLRKIRNGIVHQNIHPINKNKKWVGIRIWNINSLGLKDFAIEFKTKELKKFSKEVVLRYKESIS